MRESVQAEVMMSFLVSEELSFRIPVELRYETSDPYAVRLTFHLPGDAPVTWAFGRELLVDGVGRPCGEGDVRISPADSEVLGEVLIRLQVGGDHALFRSSVSQSAAPAMAGRTRSAHRPSPPSPISRAW
ncbi:SsgA family sporulation/cell division regulator, partial [Streptomyces eurythermus]|uniref:SsgA family sporulation/cell division regulator n=1 Tax=Streptomyces eurythermus TaxID=42237 RepID=UPI00340BAF2D